MQLAGLGASWKLATYKNPRSPVHLDSNELATSILDALANLSAGVCPSFWHTSAQAVQAFGLRG